MALGQAAAHGQSNCTLFTPTPKDQMREFNTDRPTKSNVPWTVPCGHFQYEGDFFIYTYDPSSTSDTTNRNWTFLNPTFKVGVLNNVDFEVNFSAFNIQSSQTRSTGGMTTANGFGDTFTRLKINLFGNDGGPAAMAFIPYAKWPTAPLGIGNTYVEGGVIVPLAVSLPLGFTSILMGEFDYKKNPNDNGFHGEFPALLNISRQIVEGLTGYAEIYADWSSNHDVRNIYTLDFALSWRPLPNFQLDAGVNIGLVPAAPAYQIYIGISQRF
jgi:Putative MetA-pathway of phenol degradation